MNLKKFIPNAVTAKVARQVLVSQKNSPTLLFVGGVTGVVATTVLACRATLKLDDVLDKTLHDKQTAKDLHASGHPDYSEADLKRDMAYLYIRTVVNVTKLYGPTVIVGAASIAMLTGSHNILNKRNAALTAAYAAVEKGFNEYRERVVSEFGEDKDREFRYGSETRTIVEETDKGQKKVDVKKFNPEVGASMYAKFFEDTNKNWHHIPEYNIMFLRTQQNFANDMLHARGHLMLNDVYDLLGLDRTKEGCVVGWVKNNGDNFVDFGIWDDDKMDRFHDFVTGREGCILLDFNVDGLVYDKI